MSLCAAPAICFYDIVQLLSETRLFYQKNMGNKLRFDHEENNEGDKTDCNEGRATDRDVELKK